MKNIKIILMICIFLFAAAAMAGCASPQEPDAAATAAPSATPAPTATPAPISFEDAAAANRAELRTFSDYDSVFSAVQDAQTTEENAEVPKSSSALRSAAAFSGLTESDVLCIEGEYIYALSDKNLTVFHLSGETGEKISSTPVGSAWSTSESESGSFVGSERTPLAIFLHDTRLAVVMDVYRYESVEADIHYSEYVCVDIYDVSDPSSPILLSSTGQDGVFSDAWMSGGTLCVATAYSVSSPAEAADVERFVPNTHTAAGSRSLDTASLYALPDSAEGCVVLGGYSLGAAAQKGVLAVYGAEAKDLYAVSGSLFLTDTRSVSAVSRHMSDEAGDYTEYVELVCTDIFRIDYDEDGIRPAAVGIVSGLLPEKNAFAPFGAGYVCLSETSGSYFRLYTGKDSAVPAAQSAGSSLCVLDASLAVTDSLSELPNGENIVWAGFTPETILLSGTESSARVEVSASGAVAAVSGGEAIAADALLPWKDGGFAAFRNESAGQLVLSLYDSSLKKNAERTFGSDYSSTLESLQSYIALPEKNLLGFAADDSYCLYAENDGSIAYCMSVFLSDWAWNSRAFEQNGYLTIVDRQEIYVYRVDTLENVAYFSF